MTENKNVNIFPEKIYVIMSKDRKWCLSLDGRVSRIECFGDHKRLPKIYKSRKMALNIIENCEYKFNDMPQEDFEPVGFIIKCEEIVEEKNEKH